MKIRFTRMLTGLVGLVYGLVLSVAVAGATDISGTIAATLTITDNSQLVGDVQCTVVAAPCIKFGTPNIRLGLNGFKMTGLANPNFGCSSGGPVLGEDGISTGGQTNVRVEGPGVIRQFRNHGVSVDGGTAVSVRLTTTSTNCHNGINLDASDSKVEENTTVRNSSIADRACGGIEIAGDNNLVRRNEAHGNGLATGGFFFFNDFGIALVSGTGNLVEENSVGGNVRNGIKILAAATGNVLRLNLVLGNPPIQDSQFGFFGVDIRNESASGANTFQNNVCETAINAPCPDFTPKIAGHKNTEIQ